MVGVKGVGSISTTVTPPPPLPCQSLPCRDALSQERDVNGLQADSISLLKKELAPLFAADFDRLIPCHGDVIETGAKSIFEDCFKRFTGA